MKKLIVIAGAMLMASVVNAASVQWNSGVFSAGFVGPKGENLAKSDAYTMIVSFYSDAACENLITTSSQTTAKVNGAYNAKTEDVFANDGQYYVSAILKANDGSAQIEVAPASFTIGAVGDGSINFTTGAGFDTTTKKWDATGWATTAVTPPGPGNVPEPTSGLLVLLGIAGLALKRKVA